jgi:alpha-1,2-mannosyltransferase
MAWTAQGIITCGTAIIVWVVWRSRRSHALKSATISAGALIASPYAMGYDLAAIGIPMVFFACEQLRTGWLKGEQTIFIALFAASLSIIPTAGHSPVGPILMLLLFGVILRRVWRYGQGRSPLTFPNPILAGDR